MANGNTDPLDLVKRLAESYRGIKFGRGVVGKTSHATLALFGVWALIVVRLTDNLWLDAALIGCGLVATIIYRWWVGRTQAFAISNPGLALLEGAELIEYQKWDAQIKGHPPLKSSLVRSPERIEDSSDSPKED